MKNALRALLHPAASLPGPSGTAELLAPIVKQPRGAFPNVQIIVRGDSGFCREALMKWCEDHNVDYVFGIAKNARARRGAIRAVSLPRPPIRWARKALERVLEFAELP